MLINFKVHFEDTLERFPDAVHSFAGAASERAPKNLIQTHRNRLEKVVWKHPEFVALETGDDDEGVGTHSHRKFPSNCAQGCGAAPDEMEI